MTTQTLPINATRNHLYAANSGAQACWDPRACKMKVEGTGAVKAKPDLAVVSLGVVTENRQLAAAQAENTEKMNEVIRTLKSMGIPEEDIQTQAYSITPQYDFVEGKQVFRGYRVEHTLEVTIRDISKTGRVIDAAVQSGANQVGNIRFAVSRPEVYYQQALNAAVEDAIAKARTLAGKLNIAVSPIPVQIVEESFETPIPLSPVMYQAAAPATPIQTGQIEIAARIEAVFAYRAVYGQMN